jgi:hypothetical protein
MNASRSGARFRRRIQRRRHQRVVNARRELGAWAATEQSTGLLSDIVSMHRMEPDSDITMPARQASVEASRAAG